MSRYRLDEAHESNPTGLRWYLVEQVEGSSASLVVAQFRDEDLARAALDVCRAWEAHPQGRFALMVPEDVPAGTSEVVG